MKSFGGILVAIALSSGLWTAGPSASLAQSMEFYIGRDGPAVEFREQRRQYDPPVRGCSERQAIRRAYRLGMRDPAIQSVTRRQILIDGIGRRGEYTTLALANRQGCPRIG